MSDTKVCALPGCGKVVAPMHSYTIADHPNEEYCSSACVDVAMAGVEDAKQKAKRAAKKQAAQTHNSESTPVPQEPAIDFGESGVTRRKCDRCGKNCFVCWPGVHGKYCSNTCLKLAESTGEEDMSQAAIAVEKPIVPGKKGAAVKPAKKKTAAVKAAKTPKAAKPEKEKAADGAAAVVVYPRPGTKTEKVLNMLQKGATMEQLSKEIGWAPSAFSSTFAELKKRLEIKIVTEESKAGRKYIIAS